MDGECLARLEFLPAFSAFKDPDVEGGVGVTLRNYSFGKRVGGSGEQLEEHVGVFSYEGDPLGRGRAF